MAEYLIQGDSLDAIAEAINQKAGTQAAMTPAEMVTAIGNIETGSALPEYVSRLITGEIILAEDTTELPLTHNYGSRASFMFLWSDITYNIKDLNRGATTNRAFNTGLPSNEKRPYHHTYVSINVNSGNVLYDGVSALNTDNSTTRILSKGGTLKAQKTIDSQGTVVPAKYHYVIGWVVSVT